MVNGENTGPASPAEGNETEKSQRVMLSTGEQVTEMKKQCKRIESDPEVVKLIKKYHRKSASKDDLKKIFGKKIQEMSSDMKMRLGIGNGGDGVDKFLQSTGCFENQFLYNIEKNNALQEIAKEELIDGCIEVSAREYDLTADQKERLRTSFSDKKNESVESLKIILDSPRLRKKRIREYIGSDFHVKKIEDSIDFKELHNQIVNKLDPTDPNTKKIQAAWSNMLGGIDIQGGESIQTALDRMRESVGDGKNSTDFDAFFYASDTLIPKQTKELIIDFMMKQYLPYVSIAQLEQASPKNKEAWIDNLSKKIEQKIQAYSANTLGGTDAEWVKALKEQQDNEQKNVSQLAGNAISTHHLDFETKVRLMAQFGNQRRVDQMNDFWKGHPGAIPSGPDYEKTFLERYRFRPKDTATHTGLIKKLENHLGDRMKGVEHFVPGSIMTWKTKRPDGSEMIGYYAIDEVLSEDPHDDSLIKIRFLGNNSKEVDDTGNPIPAKIALLGGMKIMHTGPRFFEYMASIVDDGEVNFVEAGKINEQLEKDKVTTYTDEEVKAELRNKYNAAEIMTEDVLSEELDVVLHDDKGKKVEDKDPEKRKIREKMSFVIQTESGSDTFEIEEIISSENGEPPRIRLWDGWGDKKKDKNGKDDSRAEYTFSEFLGLIKTLKQNKMVYRMPGKPGERFGIDQFNALMKSEDHNTDGRHKKYSTISIQADPKNKDVMSLGETDKNGVFKSHNIVQVGPKKDLCIESIDGDTVSVRIGTFKNLKKNEKGGIDKQASFKGSAPKTMPLSWLWSYLQSHNATLTSPPPKGTQFQEKSDKGNDMSWWNIFKHAHSMGTILHGDLWKAPWKAFEDQHHKDHAFAGKITAALAVEKAQRIPGIGGVLFDYDWANLMVGDANSNFQSYLDELVNKIDGMGGYHRTRMIKKWSKLHFPDPKFMAAMFASMQIFGQLYPYDGIEGEKPKQNWSWYNSITHTHAVPLPDGWPPHMPPHGDEKWPKNSAGEEIGEIEACHRLIGSFDHPLLKNLGRRFQKYSVGGHKNLLDGGVSNLEERTTMEGKQEWMESAILDGKPTEALGNATELWLNEGFPTHVSTAPYGLMMMGHVEQQILPKTQEHMKDLFQKGNHVPMFVFVQSKNLGDIFRDTMITFAYTMDEGVGDELNALITEAGKNRMTGKSKQAKNWKKRAKKFWENHGTQLMHKMTGMRDPMLNLLINAPDTFDAALEKLPASHRKKYERLKKGSHGRNRVIAYHKRLSETYDSPSHVHMDRNKGFYSGDHFRFRDGFEIGYPMAWVNWDAYWDSNFDKNYGGGGDATAGDGIFNEIRGFLYKIPLMAKEMTKQMGLTGDEQRNFIDKISKDIFEKNIEPMKRLAKQKINAKNPDAEYCSMTAMMFEMIPVQELTVGGSHQQAQAGYVIYKQQMLASVRKAKEIEAGNPPEAGFAKAIEYRQKMASQWSKIVKEQIRTDGKTLEQVEKIGSGDSRKTSPTRDVIVEKHKKAMEILQKRDGHTRNTPYTPTTDYRQRIAGEIDKEENAEDLIGLSA